jgi:hypothetical protein
VADNSICPIQHLTLSARCCWEAYSLFMAHAV